MTNASYGFLAGGGVPSGKFKSHGDTVGGPIAEDPTEQQQTNMNGEPLFWDNGDPRKQLVVTVQTDARDPEIEDDDGKRRLFIKGELRKAVQKAVLDAGAKGLDVGGELNVTYIGDGTPARPGLTPPKLYSATYAKPKATAAPAAAPAAAAPAAAPAGLPEGLSPEALELLARMGQTQQQ
ncbi:hypothetical protein PBI_MALAGASYROSE_66 [Mycobacterium phage MalagasyRose]|uniref:Uncharacterized protein n=1 Tax=Mycobacterium phage MalagasyRose TaxID=2599870 RepID=A0A5J6TF02_9CAUD|nr:hypothetical protein QEH39_gp22 [Mycobacterium phage MalagasyRose]QFG08914.1 hypothetical protein PBI_MALAGASYROSE_66 [Mycobacterium phage MalagasyRose]